MGESSADLRTAEKLHESVIFCFFPLQHISAVQTSWTRLAEHVLSLAVQFLNTQIAIKSEFKRF